MTGKMAGELKMRAGFRKGIRQGERLTGWHVNQIGQRRTVHIAHHHIVAHRRRDHKHMVNLALVRNDKFVRHANMKCAYSRQNFIVYERDLHNLGMNCWSAGWVSCACTGCAAGGSASIATAPARCQRGETEK